MFLPGSVFIHFFLFKAVGLKLCEDMAARPCKPSALSLDDSVTDRLTAPLGGLPSHMRHVGLQLRVLLCAWLAS